MSANDLSARIEQYASTPAGQPLPGDVESLIADLLAALERGEIRSAERGEDGTWRAVPWVTRGILLGFRAGHLVASGSDLSFVDKHTYPARRFTADENIRIVPGGTSAILATGAIVKRPVVITGEDGSDVIAVRQMCYLSLSYDHRLVDGADASRYLVAVKNRIEEGAFEAELGL